MNYAIDEVFEERFEYPNEKLLLNGLKTNQLFEYVSNTYLNGFINYTKPVWGAIIKRYRENEGYDYEGAANKLLNQYHSELDKIEDDVLIVATGADDSWFFWFDRDVSDCMIGRTNITPEKLITFVKKNYCKQYPIAVELTEKHFKGWIKG